MPTPSTPLWKRAIVLLLMAFAVIQFLRSYFIINTPYLDDARYEAGTERMPYQARILMAWILRAADHSRSWTRIANHLRGPLHDPGTLAIAAIGLLSLLVTALVLHRWYLLVSLSRRLPWLPFSLFLWMAYATYLGRFQEAIYFPYDLLDISLFTLALFLCFTERYLLLALLFPIACLNRETILVILLPLSLNVWLHLRPTPNLLVPAEDAASPPITSTGTAPFPDLVISTEGTAAAERPASPLLSPRVEVTFHPAPVRSPLRELSLALFCLAVWIPIHLHFAHLFAANDRSEFHTRIHENIGFLKNPQTWSQILSAAGFLLVAPFLWFRLMPNRRLRLYSALIPAWTLAMFAYGLLPESRVFGEILGLLAVYCAVQFETGTLPTPKRPAA